MAFNAKNLSYDAKQPKFLQQLRGQYGGDSQRHERSIARPRKVRLGDDEDDEPVYVDEESNEVVSKAEYDSIKAGSERVDESVEAAEHGTKSEEQTAEEKGVPAPAKDQVAGVGAKKKRKAVKAVGQDEEEGPKVTEKSKTPEPPPPKPSKTGKAKKAKKVKLSFDED